MGIELIAFDADDTLWHNENLYQEGRRRFEELLAPYGPFEDLDKRLDEIEIGNLEYYGYGVSGFVFSLMEAAIKLTNGQISGKEMQTLIELAKEMFSAQVQVLEGVEPTLAALAEEYPLMVITKGDLRHQQAKVERSGLQPYFRYIQVVSDKTPEVYATIMEDRQIPPPYFLMVGNSMRSDILPVLELGGQAVYVPHELTWSHEAIEQPDGGNHFYQLEDIRELPELVNRLAKEKH